MDTETLNFRKVVERKYQNELEVFAAARGKSNIHESLTGTSEQISVSYKGRTLIELIQNAYDPHPPNNSDGEIYICLDLTEGEHGCLYVANRGVGFVEKNFEGLCDISRSSKIVNQGIGNKGFGFRSVRQICKYPEIYSRAPGDSTNKDFDGFCFVFPRDEDLQEALSTTEHADYAEEIIKLVPRSLLPIFTDDRPGHVPNFAKEGFSTVIRMPLDRDEAVADVQDQIDKICDSELPIQLFLHRLTRIEIHVVPDGADSDDEHYCRLLLREIIDEWTQEKVQHQIVRIDDDNEYIVSKHQLPDDDFRQQLLDGIRSEELPQSWADWRDPAEISIAVHLSGSGSQGRLYNFLPMESVAASPCAGHINAPFLSDLDRRRLVKDVRLNDYFLDEIAALCLRTAAHIKESRPELPHTAVLDATMWSNGYTERMVAVAATRERQPFQHLAFVPTRAAEDDNEWTSIEDAYAWPDADLALSAFCPDSVAQVLGIRFVAPSIEGTRLDRLVAVAESVTGSTLSPTGETLAEWAEQVANNLNQRSAAIKTWNNFYHDLKNTFDDSSEVLQGRKLLLTNDGSLAPTLVHEANDAQSASAARRKSRATRAIFLPSTRPLSDLAIGEEDSDDPEETEAEVELEAKIPKSLVRFIQLVNPKLQCAQRVDDTGVRSFLIDNRLVSRFQTEDLQRLLANLTTHPGPGKNPNKRRMAALQFAFELSGRGKRRTDLTEMQFRVPSREGQWIRATESYFGAAWPGTRGKQLAELIDLTRSVCDEHQQIWQNTLSDIGNWPKAIGTLKEWTRFLIALGVNDKLRIRNVRPPGRFVVQGYTLSSELLQRCDLGKSIRDYWEDDLPAEIKNPYTEYTVRGRVSSFSGQNDFDLFSPKARSFFARELVAALQNQDESILKIRVLRPDRYDSNETWWPSPVASFLTHAPWLPIYQNDSTESFATPSGSWHLAMHALSTRLDFFPTIHGDVRTLLDSIPDVCDLLQQHCGLNVVNSGRSALQQVQLLGKLATNREIKQSSSAPFDSLYATGWDLLAGDPDELQEFLDSSMVHIAAHENTDVVGFELDRLSSAENHEQPDRTTDVVYLADDIAPTTRDLLKELGYPVFDFKFKHRTKVAAELCRNFDNLQLVSNVQLKVFTDKEIFEPTHDEELLIPNDRRWLQDTILVVCDLTAGFLNLGPKAIENLRSRLARLRYKLVSEIELEIDGSRIPLPDFAQGCLPFNHEIGPTLIIESDQPDLSWNVLQQASHAVAEGLGYPVQLSSVLGSAFAQFAQRHGSAALDRPDISDLQAVCRKGRQAVEESRRGLRHVTAALIELARPIIYAVANDQIAQQFDSAADAIDNEEDLEALLEKFDDQLPIDSDAILQACRRNEDVDGVRRDLALNVNDINAALRGLGPPYRELRFDEDHRLQFTSFVKERESDILESVRAANFDAFDAGESLGAYIKARSLAGLTPDEDWATMYDILPLELMTQQVNAWLLANNARPLDDGSQTQDIDLIECRAANRDALRSLVSEGWPLLSAWCRKNSVALPECWRTSPEACQSLPKLAYEQGWIDFRVLDRVGLIKWLASTGSWPEKMPQTIAKEPLDLESVDISSELEQAENRKLEEARLSRIVHVGDRELAVDQADISDALHITIEDYQKNRLLFETSARPTKLQKLETISKSKSGSRSGSRAKSRPPRDLPAEQKQMIGLLGERIAFEWLRATYPKAVSEQNWVSTNRELALQIGSGDDSLGYDFFVNQPSYVLYFEVKSTTGDEPFFRLGPTEVEAAIKYRADGKHRFRVLFIERVTEPEHTRILVLTNPYSNQYKDRFQLVTKGEQGFRFDPTG